MVYTVQIIPILYFSMANDIEIVHKYICLMLTPQTYNRPTSGQLLSAQYV